MGNTLPRPVTCKVVERKGNKNFKVAVCSMNGFREQMEDAHAMCTEDDWGYFAVFDGHSGTKCSKFCSEKFPEEIAKAAKPIPDSELEKITLAIDAEFISTTKESGSTATMFVANKNSDGTWDCQVGNVGDSRVIIVQNGECISMTTDHKPSIEAERARIERCGGTVQTDRVDGMLAMSRAMGDSEYKSREGSQLEQKVIPQPEIRHHTCSVGDYVLVCCDGIFESRFPNEDVVKFVNEQLKQEGMDLGTAMCNLCEEALSTGSTDNMTAMIVQFTDGTGYGPEMDFEPGPTHPHKAFTAAYRTMAEKAGITYGRALELRYDQLREKMNERAAKLKAEDTPSAEPDEQFKQLRSELSSFTLQNEIGPPKNLTGDDRTTWFEKFAEQAETKGESASDGISLDQLAGKTIPLSMLFRLAGVAPNDADGGNEGGEPKIQEQPE